MEQQVHCANFRLFQIYDGMTMDDPLIGRYCGTTIPAEFVSTSNVLYVQFHTDSTIAGAGFNASFVQQDGSCTFHYIS